MLFRALVVVVCLTVSLTATASRLSATDTPLKSTEAVDLRTLELDPANPWHPRRDSPRLLTPQWAGDQTTQAVIVLAIDDMRDPAKYEAYLRPILNRLKQIDGRAGLSIMTNDVQPDDPQLQSWLGEGLSIECHSADHPCPILQGGDFAKAKSTYDRCMDRMAEIPGNRPVAFRTPCCDSLNTVSPRFFAEIFGGTTAGGRSLQIDSSVFMFFTSRDEELPRERVLDAEGRERFLKYLPRGNRFGGNLQQHFVNYVENYPYPWVINGNCWQIPCLAPSDWSAQHLQGVNNPVTVDDWKAAIDLTVAKRGCFSLVFHPHGWIRSEQVVELIDHAVATHGQAVKFLNFREVSERLNAAYCGGKTLREQAPEFLADHQRAIENRRVLTALPEPDQRALAKALSDPARYGLPPVRRGDGSHNGFFVHDGHLCWQNEDTAKLPDLLVRVPIATVLSKARRAVAADTQPLVPVGAAVVDVTPDYPVRLTGYGNRLKEAETAAARIHARALVIGAANNLQAMLLTVDNCGVPLEMTEEVYRRIAEKVQVSRERFAISSTHSHSAPWLRGFAPNIFAEVPEDHAGRLARYEAELTDKLVQVALAALEKQVPSSLHLGYGEAGFAMNRRALKEGRWTGFGEVPEGPVDKRVPLLAARDASGKVVALLVNYACHCTTETGEFNQISGDWAGFAADILETEHPGAVALVAIGCGADANPSPRGTHEQARGHGQTLAREVQRILGSAAAMTRISGSIAAKFSRIDLPLGRVPTKEELQAESMQPGVTGSRARYFLGLLESGQPVPTTVPNYPVQTWCFGEDLAMVFLGGEVVVDYSIRLNEMFDGSRLWVNAYSNDVPCYIASARLLREGGYEVDSSMLYYRRPSRLAPEAEDLICDAVQKQLPQHFYSESLQAKFPAPKDPQESQAVLHARSGLRAVLAAAEPLIRDPVAFDWDERGRLWVVEMGDYPAGGGQTGRVRLLEDVNGDFVYDRAVTFLDGLDFPSGIQCWRDGVLITMAPQVFYAEDQNGDGVADLRQPLYAGFVEGNQQHRVNGMRWGLDGWLYLANGDSGGLVAGLGVRPGVAGNEVAVGAPVVLRGRDLRIQPDTNRAQGVAGTTQFGRERDDYGNWFGNNNSNPIWQYRLEERYVQRNPHARLAGVTSEVSAVPGAAPVFPRSRTLDRYNDFGTANRFTSACGTMIYRDIWLGPQYYGNAFTAEPVHNLVSRLVLSAEGAGFQGVRAADEQSSEFLASEDNWFRPTMLRTGPDGAVWVADMYRAVIEHPEWIPAEYQRKLALDSGSDRGRIYRIVPDVGCCSGEQPAVESQENSESRKFFAKDWKTQDLVSIAERVGSVNGWWRDAAQRMLQHRAAEASGHPGVLSALRRLAGSESAAVAAQALATLAMLSEGKSDRDLVPAIQAGLRHADPRVRAMAVQLLEPQLRLSAGEVLQAVASLESDPDERVQLQLVLSLGEVPGDAAAPLLGRLLAAAVNREWVQRAGLTSLTAENVGGVLDAVLRLNADGTEELVGRLLSQAAEFGRAESLGVPVQRMLQRVSEEPGRVNFAAVSGVLRTVLAGSAGDTLRAEKSVQELMEAARRSAAGVAWDVTAESGQRAACVGFLDAVGVEPEKLSDLLQPQVPLEVQRVAASVISRRGGETTVSAVLQAFGGLSPVVREEVLEGLLSRSASVNWLLSALESGVLSPVDLSAAQRDRLLSDRRDAVAQQAQRLLAVQGASDRAAVVEQQRQQLEGVSGQPAAGAVVFEKRCGSCHRLQNIGREVGADLAALKDRSTNALLTAILDPNQAVESKFLSYTAVTTEGVQHVGMLRGENGNAITLLGSDGREQTLSRGELELLKASKRSLMPEGLEKDLSVQDLADVIAFVQSAGAVWKQFEGNQPAAGVLQADGSILLPASGAEIYGPSLVYEEKYGNLGFWCSTEDYARWTFEVPRSGDWRVQLEFACDDGTAGSAIRFSTGTRLLTARVPGTGTWDEYRRWEAGTIDLHRGRGQLIVTAPEKPGMALIDLKAIRLLPPQ